MQSKKLTRGEQGVKHRCVPDAIHPRFKTKDDHLFKCRTCDYNSPDEKKIQKHYFKTCPALSEKYPRYSCPLPECNGPSFTYSYNHEVRLYHNCRKWAKYVKRGKKSKSFDSILSIFSFSSSETSPVMTIDESIMQENHLEGQCDSPPEFQRQIAFPIEPEMESPSPPSELQRQFSGNPHHRQNIYPSPSPPSDSEQHFPIQRQKTFPPPSPPSDFDRHLFPNNSERQIFPSSSERQLFTGNAEQLFHSNSQRRKTLPPPKPERQFSNNSQRQKMFSTELQRQYSTEIFQKESHRQYNKERQYKLDSERYESHSPEEQNEYSPDDNPMQQQEEEIFSC